MTRQLSLLQSPAFLGSVSLLLLNDFILKSAYPGWLTGKLSDFAGLFAFALFWIAFFPAFRKVICWSVAICFVFWKAPYSQSAIELWNTLTGLHYTRVIDYTDFLALPVLALAYKFSMQETLKFRLHIPLAIPFAIAVFAFLATSNDDYDTVFILDETFQLALSKIQIEDRMERSDSLAIEWGAPISEDMMTDSLYISYFAPHCGNFQWAEILLTPTSDTTTDLTCTILYYCTNDQDRRAHIVAEFEREVIEKLSN